MTTVGIEDRNQSSRVVSTPHCIRTRTPWTPVRGTSTNASQCETQSGQENRSPASRQCSARRPTRSPCTPRLGGPRRLLLESEASVTGISLELGFSSLGTFSARFARDVGVSPSRFRRTAARSRPDPPSCLGLMAGEAAPAESNFEEASPGPSGRD